MSFQEKKKIFPLNRKNLYFSLATVCAILSLLLVTLVLFWALPNASLPQQQHSSATQPTKVADKGTTPGATASPRPGTVTPTAKAAVPAATSTTTSGVAASREMLHGTNMSLFDANDQILNSAATQAMLQRMHVGIVRIPMRPTLSEATMLQAAQIVKNIGASAMIILERPESDIPTAISNDRAIIGDMNTIFGNQVVYYEYGNEPDLAGTPGGTGDPAPYIASWNQNIPILKKAANNGRFIGPVMYRYVPSYLSSFLRGARPLPDFVSWHEYTCSVADAPYYCLLHVDNWGAHDVDARTIMNNVVGTTIPIMITEWNYTPADVAGDGKHDNAAFMTQWTQKALQSFADNGVYAAMQYSCANAQIPLVKPDNTLTPQGAVFQSSSV